ncbi:hypothetical protein EYF80_038738 [Liparis tanakae]|uniref:Uncharacterized protein n=1 Tax=Liparis tanakae TaxID=230148 RepID=A0A4Z2GBT9_9TELE|nr:hypothetical protein EYF80_038738 [Liparis tanakae]
MEPGWTSRGLTSMHVLLPGGDPRGGLVEVCRSWTGRRVCGGFSARADIHPAEREGPEEMLTEDEVEMLQEYDGGRGSSRLCRSFFGDPGCVPQLDGASGTLSGETERI